MGTWIWQFGNKDRDRVLEREGCRWGEGGKLAVGGQGDLLDNYAQRINMNLRNIMSALEVGYCSFIGVGVWPPTWVRDNLLRSKLLLHISETEIWQERRTKTKIKLVFTVFNQNNRPYTTFIVVLKRTPSPFWPNFYLFQICVAENVAASTQIKCKTLYLYCQWVSRSDNDPFWL